MRYARQNTLGVSFVTATLANASATTLIAAASNVRGMVIRAISIAGGGGTAAIAFYADAAAPTGTLDTGKRRVLFYQDAAHLNGLALPLFVAAGEGFFAWATASSPTCSVAYDLL